MGKEKRNSELLVLLYQSIHGGGKPGAKVIRPRIMLSTFRLLTHAEEPLSLLAARPW